MSSLWSQTTHLGARQSLPQRYHPHTICGPHTLACESPPRMSDCWLTASRVSYWNSSCPKALEREPKNFWRKWTPSLCQLWGCYSWKWALLPTSNTIQVSAGSQGPDLPQLDGWLLESFRQCYSKGSETYLFGRGIKWEFIMRWALCKIIYRHYCIYSQKTLI